jgi:hypothetical protein
MKSVFWLLETSQVYLMTAKSHGLIFSLYRIYIPLYSSIRMHVTQLDKNSGPKT